MTDGPGQSEGGESPFAGVQFNVLWPDDAAAAAPVVTHMGILGDGTGDPGTPEAGFYLLMGQVAPPPWFSPIARDRGLAAAGGTSPDIPVRVHAAVYLTRARAEELYELLHRHLGKERPDG
jgi:hypothetical protein